MTGPEPLVASRNWELYLPELVQRFRRKMRSPAPLESNWASRSILRIENISKMRGLLAGLRFIRYGAPHVAGGGRGTGIKPSPRSPP